MSKKLLFIVEGELEEPRILDANGKGLLNLIGDDFEIISLNTSIYELYEICKDNNYDTISYLSSIGKIKLDKNELPKSAFSAIYLVFDFEPHYQKYSDDKILDMLNLFCDETDLGKLYINYPMVESFYHITKNPDFDFLDSTVCLSKFNGEFYKNKVYKESFIRHKPISPYEIRTIIKHNFKKAEKICNADFSEYIDHNQILKNQLEIKNKKNELYILNTLSLLPVDYNPIMFKKLINSKFK